jgi:broad specificity phosphatase PhoE
MKVGLIRHFEVDCPIPGISKLMTPDQFRQWLQEYETSDIKYDNFEANMMRWDKCYSSDLPRALKTAQKIYSGHIIATKELRELVICPPTDRNIKLPILLWLTLGRMAWMLSHKSQIESKLMFQERVKYILEEFILKDDQEVLIVSHGFLMMFLRKELLKLGFKGPNFRKADNAKVYIFEK